MIKPDLLPTILLLININNLRPAKSLKSTDRFTYAKCPLSRPWGPHPPDSSTEMQAPKSARALRQSGADLTKPRPEFTRLFVFYYCLATEVSPGGLIPINVVTFKLNASKVQNSRHFYAILRLPWFMLEVARSCFWASAAVF